MSAEVRASFDNSNGKAVVDLVLDDDRAIFLTIGGEKAFQTGYWICDTCRYIFTKLTPAQRLTDRTTEDVAARLSAQLRDINEMPVENSLLEFAAVLPRGTYSVVLTRLVPQMVMPGDGADYFAREAVATWGVDPYFGVGHSPQTPYYRLGTANLGPVEYGGKRLGVVLGVPLFPPTQRIMNRAETIDQYRKILTHGTEKPTVLAVGLADDRGPATWGDPAPEFSRHLLVSLYILDGHHKIAAAAAENLPIQFLKFLPHFYANADWTEPVDAGVDLLRQLAVT